MQLGLPRWMRGLGLSLVVAFSTLAAADPAQAQCNASQLCAAGANPCEIAASCVVPAGSTFDIRPRAFVIKEGKTLTIDDGTAPLTILAGSILLEKGARISADGVPGIFGSGGAVSLTSTTTFTMLQGSSPARIDVSGEFSGGTIEINATGDVSISGQLRATVSNVDGFGGQIDIASDAGSVSFLAESANVRGGGRGENGASGGSIGVFAQNNITLNSDLDAGGGDCVCDISLDAATGNVTIANTADIMLDAVGDVGDGGSLNISAGGTVSIANRTVATARGSGGEDGEGSGTGGDLDVFATGTVTIAGRVDVDGSGPDGDAGGIDIQSDLDINLMPTSNLHAPTDGLGAGGDVFLDAGRNLTMAGEIDVRARDIGGSVDATAVGSVTINGPITAKTTGTPITAGGTAIAGGLISIQGCTIDVQSSAILDPTGLGPFPSATNLLQSSNGMTIRGKLLAGTNGTNRLEHLTGTPAPQIISPAVVTPAAQVAPNPALPCCVACAQCGDGVVGGSEQCDDHNTANGDCCNANCMYEPNNNPCTSDNNACTVDVCNTTGACTHNAGNAGATCRMAAGVCDLAETCTGSSPTCPADVKSTTQCRPAAGVCDAPETCDGVGNNCPANAFQPSSTVCRGAGGVCDVAESCTGSSAACPADVKSTAQCRAAAPGAVCDVAESCNGVGNDCPADGVASSATVCRPSAGDCDQAENCTGSSTTCPADAKRTGQCRGVAGTCDIAESCDGVTNNCPADVLRDAGTPCRESGGMCDIAESCTGSSPACPADQKSTAECRGASGVCDVAESCNGTSNDCPADGVASTATVCRGSAGDCDLAETCDGAGKACPADAKRTDECRASTGVCDVAEVCDGVGNACPADEFAPNGSECGGDACTQGGTCTDGTCEGGDPVVCPLCETCDPENGCVEAPKTACLEPIQAEKAQLQIKRPSKGPSGDTLTYKWTKGAATSYDDFGDPSMSTDVALCLYDAADALTYRADIAAGGMCGTKPCWTAKVGKGFKYSNKLGNASGINTVDLKAGEAGKAQIQVKGKGVNLTSGSSPMPSPPLGLPVLVQFQSESGKCWQATFSAAGVSKNEPGQFKAKSD